MVLRKRIVLVSSSALAIAVNLHPMSAVAFEDKDCARVETVQQKYSIDLKASESVEFGRSKATGEIVKQAIAQVIGYEVHSDREQRTQVTNEDAQEKYQDAEKAFLDGLARIRILDETRTALPSGQTLVLTAEVKVCVPKPDAIRRAEKKEERALHPPKMVDATKAVWFNPATGEPQIWYSRSPDGNFRFFDNTGFDPDSGEPLRPITQKALQDWRDAIARQQREAAAQAEAEKRAAERRALDEERDRLAATRHADLISHARDNCDKLAANPNDPEKPKAISGATFDELRPSTDQAIEACSAAIQIEPTDRRLQYQLARAISVNDPKKAMPLFKALCDQRYAAAFDNYGWAFVDKRVGLHNLEAALASFKKGVQLGDSDAMVSLASYIQRGRVPGSSVAGAISLYQRAAALGNADATKALEPILASLRQTEQQQEIDRQNAQMMMGVFSQMVGGMRR